VSTAQGRAETMLAAWSALVAVVLGCMGCARACHRGQTARTEPELGPLTLERVGVPDVIFRRALAWGTEGQESVRVLLVERPIECGDVSGTDWPATTAPRLRAPATAGATLRLTVHPTLIRLERRKSGREVYDFVVFRDPRWNLGLGEGTSTDPDEYGYGTSPFERVTLHGLGAGQLGKATRLDIRWVVRAGEKLDDDKTSMLFQARSLQGRVEMLGCGIQRPPVAPRPQPRLDFRVGERRLEIQGARLVRVQQYRGPDFDALELSTSPMSCDKRFQADAALTFKLELGDVYTENLVMKHPDVFSPIKGSATPLVPIDRADAGSLLTFRVHASARSASAGADDPVNPRLLARNFHLEGIVEALDCRDRRD